MLLRHQLYQQKNGFTETDGNVMLSLRQSFHFDENITPEKAHEVMRQLAEEFIGNDYQYVIATHIDQHCIHSHIMMNYIGSDYKKWHDKRQSAKLFQKVSDRICKENSLSILEPELPGRSRVYSKHPTRVYRKVLKNDIDWIIPKVSSWDQFLLELSKQYFVKASGKHISVRHRTNGQKRNIRLYTLDSAYTEAALKQRIGTEAPIIVEHTYSAQLSFAKQLFQTHRFLVKEQITDYESLHQYLNQNHRLQKEIEEDLNTCREKLQALQDISGALKIVNAYQDIVDELQWAVLKDRFEAAHQKELHAYRTASAFLEQQQINLTTDPNSFKAEQEALTDQLKQLEQRYEAAVNRLHETNQIKQTIDRILQDRFEQKTKGRKQDDR